MSNTRPKRSTVTVTAEDGSELGLEIDNDNYTVITAAGDDEDLEHLAAEAGEGGTVIEVPVSYTDLQAAGHEAFVLQEADDDEPAVDEDEDDSPEEAESDSDFDPNDYEDDKKKSKKKSAKHNIEVEKCSICGATVADLAIHIVNMHSASSAQPIKAQKSSVIVKTNSVKAEKRSASPVQHPFGLKPRKRAYTKGKYQQIKPVLRFPCDACKHVSKTSEQLKKHMIMAHKGNKATSWMFCGECEYATRVEEELVNHVKMHQMFSILKDDMIREDNDDAESEDDEIDEEAIIRAATGGTGLGNYDPNPMSCGDCDFETHYENELFEHLKMHLRKEANLPDDTEEEVILFLRYITVSIVLNVFRRRPRKI